METTHTAPNHCHSVIISLTVARVMFLSVQFNFSNMQHARFGFYTIFVFEIQVIWLNHSWYRMFFSSCLLLYLHLFICNWYHLHFTLQINNKNSRAYQNLLTHLYPLNYRINLLTYCTLIFFLCEYYVTCISRRR